MISVKPTTDGQDDLFLWSALGTDYNRKIRWHVYKRMMERRSDNVGFKNNQTGLASRHNGSACFEPKKMDTCF